VIYRERPALEAQAARWRRLAGLMDRLLPGEH
jgi:hypothetical protein